MAKRRMLDRETPADTYFRAGLRLLETHPLLGRLGVRVCRAAHLPYPRDGWASVSATGNIYVHPMRLAAPEEWLFVLAHCGLHLCFGHFQPCHARATAKVREWNVACDCVCAHFLQSEHEVASHIETRIAGRNIRHERPPAVLAQRLESLVDTRHDP